MCWTSSNSNRKGFLVLGNHRTCVTAGMKQAADGDGVGAGAPSPLPKIFAGLSPKHLLFPVPSSGFSKSFSSGSAPISSVLGGGWGVAHG